MGDNKCYSELITIPKYIDRYRYLQLNGAVGKDTFGYMRFMNQAFYTSTEWRKFRRDIILRDNGNDMGVDGYFIGGPITIHHIVPLEPGDLLKGPEFLMNPENVICVSADTHKAIHYGNESLILNELIVRKPNDTIPWR